MSDDLSRGELGLMFILVLGVQGLHSWASSVSTGRIEDKLSEISQQVSKEEKVSPVGKFYEINGKRAYFEINGKPVEQYFQK